MPPRKTRLPKYEFADNISTTPLNNKLVREEGQYYLNQLMTHTIDKLTRDVAVFFAKKLWIPFRLK